MNDATPDAPASGEPAPLSHAEKLWRIRHSCAHIMAQAVLEIFPDASLAIGPPIADGFYYDFDLPRTLSPDDLDAIEERMRRIVKGNHSFKTWSVPKEEAVRYFEERNQRYKVELIAGLPGDDVRFYQQDTFIDLCAGPHVQRTGECKAFKLTRIAGAYWRGDATRPMLQRIYGTAWKNKQDLEAHLTQIEEAKKRDHRKLGRELDLYSFHAHSPGAALWHPRGLTVYRQLRRLFEDMHQAAGYVEISNPLLYNKALFEQSGHWDHYRDNMFQMEVEGETFCLKPMNCPDTMLYYKTKRHSYRELPLRVAEVQTLHRNELSGTLSGLFRVRQFTQDDAHIFLREDQIREEIEHIVRLIDQIYGVFGLRYRTYLSTRPDDFMGEAALWDDAEEALRNALQGLGRPFKVKEGDGAFYGPKIDFEVLDSLGRRWQCATIQLDFQLPRRFDLTYTDRDNAPKTPVLIHRALFGSFERFLGILVEHFAGAFPTWLAPVQALFLPINDACAEACYRAADHLRAHGLRVEVDDRSEKLGYKIREAELRKVPHMLVVGHKELEEERFAHRTFQRGDEGSIALDALRDELLRRTRERTFDVTLQTIDLPQVDDDTDTQEPAY